LGIFISQRDKKQLLETASELLESGVAVEQLAEDLLDYFRNLLLIKSGIRRESLLSFAASEFSTEVLEAFSAPQLEKALELLLELHRALRFSASPRFDLELALYQLAELGDFIPPGELLKSLRSLKAAVLAESGAAAGAVSAGAAEVPDGRGGTLRAAASGPDPLARPATAPKGTGGASSAAAAAASVAAAAAADAGAGAPAEETAEEGEPGIAGSPEDSESPPASAAAAGLKPLLEAVRREKLALAASLQKAESWSLESGELRLVYSQKDRYPGVQVSRERDTVIRLAAGVFPGVTRLRVDFSGQTPGGGARNAQAEMVKKIFRGEVIKGE